MSELLTAAQMRAIEQAAIESGEVTGLELMERAGQGVVEAIFEEWPELANNTEQAGGQPPAPRSVSDQEKRAVVLCGPGNNGGDGFVVARLLFERGWDVEVFLYGEAEKLPPDARVNYERWAELGEVTTRRVDPPPLVDESISFPHRFDVLVDGLFGTGLGRPLGGVFAMLADEQAVELLRDNMVRVVAIDTPSGLCSDSGKALGPVLQSNLTVSFHTRKLGHELADGPAYAGKTVVVDIGLGGSDEKGPETSERWRTLEERDCVECAIAVSSESPSRNLGKLTNGHKFSHGHALILSGGSGKTGAARLVARGALRVGAGLVTLGVPPSAQQEVACQITALMLQRVADAEALESVLQDDRLNALCLGPGMGIERAREFVPVALSSKRATVLDADALSAFAENPTALFEQLHDQVVLTPHGGEFARLFPDIAAKLAETPTKGPAYSKVDATREAAARAGCVVLFKGPDTVIASPDGRCSVNAAVYDRSAPWLATAGSGDVLAGFITGLLARGFAPHKAAETAAWLHVECAREFGPGLIAEDLPEMLPQVLKVLESG